MMQFLTIFTRKSACAYSALCFACDKYIPISNRKLIIIMCLVSDRGAWAKVADRVSWGENNSDFSILWVSHFKLSSYFFLLSVDPTHIWLR